MYSMNSNKNTSNPLIYQQTDPKVYIKRHKGQNSQNNMEKIKVGGLTLTLRLIINQH